MGNSICIPSWADCELTAFFARQRGDSNWTGREGHPFRWWRSPTLIALWGVNMGILVCGLLETSTADVVPKVRNSPKGPLSRGSGSFCPRIGARLHLRLCCRCCGAWQGCGRCSSLGQDKFQRNPRATRTSKPGGSQLAALQTNPKTGNLFLDPLRLQLGTETSHFLGAPLAAGPKFRKRQIYDCRICPE